MMAATVAQLAINGFGGTEDPNSVSFLLPALTTRTIGGTTYQVCAYKSASSKLVLGKRSYPGGAWTLFHYDGIDKTDLGDIEADAHNVSVVAIDADGLVHFSYNHHSYSGHIHTLKYRRSDAAIGSWTGGVTALQSMLGTNESSVTYPVFFRSPTGKLYFAFRDGVSGDGDWYLYEWNDTADTWSGVAGTTAGLLIEGKTANFNAYPDGAPKFTSNWDGAGTGFMHWSWMWRGDGAGGSAVATNQDIGHVKWDGTNWKTMDGTAQTVPITKANQELIWDIGPSVGLFNTCDMDLTSTGRPVIAVIKNDGSNITQLWALYWNGSAWANHQITSYAAGTLGDLIRPIVLIDRDTDVCYIIGGNTIESRRDVIQWQSAPGDFTSWTRKVFYSRPLYGGAELNYDRALWLSDKIITGLITRRRSNALNIEVGIIEADTAGIDPRVLGAGGPMMG